MEYGYELVKIDSVNGNVTKTYRFPDAAHLQVFIETKQTPTMCQVRGYTKSRNGHRQHTIHKEIFTGENRKMEGNMAFRQLAKYYL